MRVLVVDDFPDVSDALSVLLGVLGHEVITARDGRGGLASVSGQLPDVGLFDVGLPDVSGYELARQVRRRPGGRWPYLVAITGWGTHKDHVDALAAGFDMHLVKPIDAVKVTDVMRAAEDVLRDRRAHT